MSTVAQTLVADAITAVRTATAHDVDTQVTNAQITFWLDKEYRRVRRWLSTFMPELYETTAPLFTLAGVQSGVTIAKPVDYERIVRLEAQWYQASWYPLAVRPQLNAGSGLPVDVSGTYRLVYVTQPVDGYTTLDVPVGCEDLIIQPVAALVRQRHGESPKFHLDMAAQLKKDLRADLAMRYGAHGRSALQQTCNWYPRCTFYEEGDHFVIV